MGKEKQFVTHANAEDKFAGFITYGDRTSSLPDGAVISITLGERLSVWKTVVNAMVSQLVIKQMKKSEGLLYAELKGHLKEGYGFTMTVWERKAMKPFRDQGAHKFAMRFFSWVFYGKSSQAYFLTYKANGTIPTIEAAYELVKAHGRFYNSGKLIRTAKKPVQEDNEQNKTV